MNILIADDHQLIREGLRYSLERHFDDLEIYEAKNGGEVIEMVSNQQRSMDLILLDLYMPGVQGFSLLSTLCNGYTETPVLVLSASSEPELMHKALDHGASGFLTKDTDNDIIIQAIHLVLAGGVYLPPAIINRPIDPEDVPETAKPNVGRDEGSSRTLRIRKAITRRQRQVLTQLSIGKSTRDISASLHLSESTIKGHIAALFKLLGATNRIQAVIEAQKLGILF